MKVILALTVGAFLVAGCTNADRSVPEATGNPGAWSAVAVSAEDIDNAVAQLPEIVNQAMAETGVPGISVVVVHNDEVALAEGFGVRDVETGAPVDADTVFQLASVSKPLGATAVSVAVGEGTVSWDDRVVEYYPEFALSDPTATELVTIGDLYSHRSGLPPHAGDELEDLGFDRTVMLERLRYLPLGPFRDQYAYTNAGLTAAAQAVANASNLSWEDFSEQKLYEPLGMTSTSSRYEDYLTASNRAVTHQQQEDGSWAPGEPRDPDAQSPAGGASSSANDLAQWLRLQLGDGTIDGQELIPADVIQEMRQPRALSFPASEPDARAGHYGYGINSGTNGAGMVTWNHSGAFFLGAATRVQLWPALDLGMAVLTNGLPIGVAEAIVQSFDDVLVTGEVQRDWVPLFDGLFAPTMTNPSRLADQEPPADPTPPAELATYAGTYTNNYVGTAVVEVTNDGLVLRLGPDLSPYPLTHFDGDTFTYEPPGENGLGPVAVDFDPGAGSVTIENLNTSGQGTLIRD